MVPSRGPTSVKTTPKGVDELRAAPAARSTRSPCGVACERPPAGSANARSPLAEPHSSLPSRLPSQPLRRNFRGRSIRLAIRSIVVLSLNSGRLSGLGFRARASTVPVGRVGCSRPSASISKSYVVWLSHGEEARTPSPDRNCPNALGSQAFTPPRARDGSRSPKQGMFRRLRDGSFVSSTRCPTNATRARGWHVSRS